MLSRSEEEGMQRRLFLAALALAPTLCQAAPSKPGAPAKPAALPRAGAVVDNLVEPGLLDVDPHGPRVVVGCGLGKTSGSVLLLERETGTLLWALATRGLRDCYFCDDGRLLFVATPDGWSMWDTVSYKPKAQVRIANKAAGATRSGGTVIVSQGAAIKLYDERGKLVDTFAGGSDKYDRLLVTSDANNFALYSRTGFYLYDVPSRNNFAENLGSVAFHPDGQSMVRQSPTGWMIDLKLQTGTGLTKPVQTHTGSEVSFSPDGKLILSQGTDENGNHLAQTWKFPHLEPVASHRLSVPTSEGRSRFSSDGVHVASWDPSGLVEVWNSTTGALKGTQRKLPSKLRTLAIGPDWLAAVGGSGSKGFYRSLKL